MTTTHKLRDYLAHRKLRINTNNLQHYPLLASITDKYILLQRHHLKLTP